MHRHDNFFLKPKNPLHKQYEALRAFYVEGRSAAEVARALGLAKNYFDKLRSLFHQRVRADEPPAFLSSANPAPSRKLSTPPFKKRSLRYANKIIRFWIFAPP